MLKILLSLQSCLSFYLKPQHKPDTIQSFAKPLLIHSSEFPVFIITLINYLINFMQEKFTPTRASIKYLSLLLTGIVMLTSISNKSAAQAFCNNEVVFWLENFGTGTTATSHPDVIPAGLTYQANGPLQNEGVYRVINNSQQKPEWHNSIDHTAGDVNGKMLVVNGQSETFFQHTTNRPTGFAAGFYSVSLYLMNVNTPGTCAPNPLLPIMSFKVEYQDANNAWVSLINSPISSAAVPQTATPTWVALGGVFVLPLPGAFIVHNIRVTLSDGTSGGCGNDFAVDDIKLATCPDGGPLPVQFVNVTAQQRGTGVNVQWSTASEINNKYFDVERSTDAGQNWSIIATVNASGNSTATKNYTAYDAKPSVGSNLYRIKQADIDGRIRYSSIASIKLNIDKTSVSVVANPFTTNIVVDFLSTGNQQLNSRLIGIDGRQVFSSAFTISKGSNRKAFAVGNNLKSGMYILQITDENGVILYNDKLIKQ